MKNWIKSDPTASDVEEDAVELRAVLCEDYAFDARERCKVGQPRLLALENHDKACVRIVPTIDLAEHASRRGADDRRDRNSVNRLIGSLTLPHSLLGPSNLHEVDELAAKLFDEAPNFSGPIEAIRRSAQTIIRKGARWMQFRPTVIESAPGSGKTTLVHRLAELSGLPLIYLDCSTMTTLTAITSQDASWGGARASEILEGLALHEVANSLVVLDELDKFRDHSRNASPKQGDSLVGMLEKRSASAHLDHFTQLTIDLSFLNWIILVNDLEQLSRPLLDRCQVIRLAPPTAAEIEIIAAREVARRGLEPELVGSITTAVRRGRITSLRSLHKLLDAAAAASARPLLN